MNERIRELALQAGCKVMDDGEWYIPTAKGLEKVVYTSGIGLEKFAELIVWECIDTVNKRYMGDNNREDMEVRRCVEDLKQHFGVEE